MKKHFKVTIKINITQISICFFCQNLTINLLIKCGNGLITDKIYRYILYSCHFVGIRRIDNLERIIIFVTCHSFE